jgi:hypothetical protein
MTNGYYLWLLIIDHWLLTMTNDYYLWLLPTSHWLLTIDHAIGQARVLNGQHGFKQMINPCLER